LHQDFLPAIFKPPLAIHILHVTPEELATLRAAGLLPADDRGRISRAGIETLLGRALTAEEIVVADARLEPRRQINARHYLKRLAREAGAALADRCSIRPRSPAP